MIRDEAALELKMSSSQPQLQTGICFRQYYGDDEKTMPAAAENAWTTQMVQVHARDQVQGSSTHLNQITDYVCVLFVL